MFIGRRNFQDDYKRQRESLCTLKFHKRQSAIIIQKHFHTKFRKILLFWIRIYNTDGSVVEMRMIKKYFLDPLVLLPSALNLCDFVFVRCCVADLNFVRACKYPRTANINQNYHWLHSHWLVAKNIGSDRITEFVECPNELILNNCKYCNDIIVIIRDYQPK